MLSGRKKNFNHPGLRLIVLFLIFYSVQVCFSSIPYDLIKSPLCVVRDEVTGKSYPLSPEKSQYNVIITDGFAHIQLTQKFVNRFENVNDIVYVFPLPHEGSIHAMSMEYDDSLYQARIFEKQKAQHIYDSVVAAGGNAALLIQDKPNIFQQRLANIAKGKEAYVRIELSMPLQYESGVFELALPTMVAARYGGITGTDVPSNLWNPPENVNGQRLQFNVVIHTGYEIADVTSPSHAISISDLESSRGDMESRGVIGVNDNIPAGFNYCTTLLQSDTYPNRDFILRFSRKNKIQDFSVASFRDTARDEGFFALSLYPDPALLDGQRPDLEIVMLIDISGSQSGWPLQKEKEIAASILTRLHPADKFTVISFNNSNSWAFGHSKVVGASEDNITQAVTFINSLTAGGGTELLNGIKSALSVPLESDKKRIYVFLTDGFISNESEIFDEIKTHPTRPTVFTFGAGNSLNRYFLDEAADIGNGFSTVITEFDDLETMVNRAWDKIESPQLNNISLSFGNGIEITDLVKPASSSLYKGSPYTVFGKYSGGGSYEVSLTGYRNGEKIVLAHDIEFANRKNLNMMLPQIWAKQRISELRTEEGVFTINKDRIIKLSEDYQVLSDYTAFLAINPAAVEEGYSYADNEFMVGLDELDNLRTSLSITLVNGQLRIVLPDGETVKSIHVYSPEGRRVFEWYNASSTTTENYYTWDGRRKNGAYLRPGRYIIKIVTNVSTHVKTFSWSKK